MAFTNGFGGTVTAGSLTLSVENWSGDIECEALDTTSTADGGFQTNIAGVKKGDITVHTYYDSSVAYAGTFGPGNTYSGPRNLDRQLSYSGGPRRWSR